MQGFHQDSAGTQDSGLLCLGQPPPERALAVLQRSEQRGAGLVFALVRPVELDVHQDRSDEAHLLEPAEPAELAELAFAERDELLRRFMSLT